MECWKYERLFREFRKIRSIREVKCFSCKNRYIFIKILEDKISWISNFCKIFGYIIYIVSEKIEILLLHILLFRS